MLEKLKTPSPKPKTRRVINQKEPTKTTLVSKGLYGFHVRSGEDVCLLETCERAFLLQNRPKILDPGPSSPFEYIPSPEPSTP